MDYKQGKYLIVSKDNLSKNCFSFEVSCPDVATIAKAGQFAHIKADGFSLRRPISICEINEQKGTIRLVFEIRGEGTGVIAQKKQGDFLDLIAPLGNGFTLLEKDKKAVVIGGGIGVPPMLQVGKHYGENATAIIGFRSADAVILDKDFIKNNIALKLCTDDGTKGQRGYVSDALKAHFETEKVDIIYACGPHLMLKSVLELATKHNIPCEVSLEERMGCGVGACLVCACKTVKNGTEYYAHVCKDGPVFKGEEVVL